MFIYDEDLRTYKDTDFAEFEIAYGITLPSLYKNLMSKYGAGLYNDFLRVHLLEDIVSRTEEAASTWREYPEFFWPQSNSIISKKNAQKCIVLADSLDGDVVGYDPETMNVIVFPRHDDLLFIIKDNFVDPSCWPNECLISALSLPQKFSPLHNSKTKNLILQRKKKWFASNESNAQEDISSHAEKLEALHNPQQFLRISDEDYEIIYSKRWAGRLQLRKFSTVYGERLSIQISCNEKSFSIIDADLKRLFSLKYKTILSQ